MLTNKLVKPVVLYRNQFEHFMLDIFDNNIIERLSIELDSIIFRIKYMHKNNLDLDKIPELKKEFTTKAIEMRKCFSTFLFQFICKIITIPAEYSLNELIDILAENVTIDQSFIKFDMIVISDNKDFLKYVDSSFKDNEVFNMFPDEYFRFYTDSYNDGIAKAFPELFENKYQDKIGSGDDSEVFVHSVTIQSGEACNLCCTYCLSGDALIHTAGGYPKKIKDIKVGDFVKAFNEFPKLGNIHPTKLQLDDQIFDAEVTQVFKHKSTVCEIKSPYIRSHLYITPNHKVLTNNGWKEVQELNPNRDKIAIRDSNSIIFTSNFTVFMELHEADVYNIETTSGTYIANGLCVHNCYQFNKTEMRMNLDTAIEFIENLVTDKYSFVNRYNSPALILEFIGGEPFLEIDLTRKAYEYFLKRCYELNHPWFMLHRLSICSNGLLYFEPEVQSFFYDYHSQISFNISIDGNKKLHDSCRIQPNGQGSYDVAIAALNHFNTHYSKERNSKMTLAPSNISYLSESVIDFIKNDMTVINLNCVFEEGWTVEHAKTEYNELKKVANYLLDNDLEHIYISIFRDRQEGPLDKTSDGNFCGGGSGSMLSVRPNGQFYPCIRFMPTSLGDGRKDFCMGNVKDGMIGREEGSEILNILDNVTRRSQSNDICYECPIANACANCSACGVVYFDNVNKKTTFTCIMNVAEALANVYYWNAVSIKHPEWNMKARRNVLPDQWSLLIIDTDELELLKMMESAALMNEIENRAEQE